MKGPQPLQSTKEYVALLYCLYRTHRLTADNTYIMYYIAVMHEVDVLLT